LPKYLRLCWHLLLERSVLEHWLLLVRHRQTHLPQELLWPLVPVHLRHDLQLELNHLLVL
jgi:hypothetical protein